LSKRLDQLNTLADHCEEMLCLIDRKSHRIEGANAALVKATGLEAPTLIGQSFYDIFEPQDNQTQTAILSGTPEGKKKLIKMKGQLKCANDTTRTVKWRIVEKESKWHAVAEWANGG